MVFLGILIGIFLSSLVLIVKEFINDQHTYDLKTQRIIMQREFSNWLLANNRELWKKYTSEVNNP